MDIPTKDQQEFIDGKIVPLTMTTRDLTGLSHDECEVARLRTKALEYQ